MPRLYDALVGQDNPPTDPQDPSDADGGSHDADSHDADSHGTNDGNANDDAASVGGTGDNAANPFAGIPILGDLGAMFGGAGMGGPGMGGGAGMSKANIWENASQIAKHIATGGSSEQNVDPLERVTLEQLVRVAELHVAKITGLDPLTEGAPTRLELVVRSQWTEAELKRYQPLMERISKQLGLSEQDGADLAGSGLAGADPTSADPADMLANQGAAIFGQLMRYMNPVTLGVCAGTMVGNMAQTAFGDYDLLVPASADLVRIVGPNVSEFSQQWSLDISGVLLWVCIRQLAAHALLSVPHIRAAITELLERYTDAFQHDPESLQRQMEEQLSQGFLGQDFEGSDGPADFASMQGELAKVLGNPELLLGAGQTEEQAEIAAELGDRMALIDAYVNHVLTAGGHRLITDYDALTEALRRRQPFNPTASQFLPLLLGVGISDDQAERASRFVGGVLERAGEEGLAQLCSDAKHWPTDNEIDAPGLWLERISIGLADLADTGSAEAESGDAEPTDTDD